MNIPFLYEIVGDILFGMGLYSLVIYSHLFRKIIALNVSGAGVFLFLVAAAERTSGPLPDPVPHAMVLTGIVVAVSATALALALACRIHQVSGSAQFTDNESE
jgi:multicomponent Na+:H+ antiporter subunit C